VEEVVVVVEAVVVSASVHARANAKWSVALVVKRQSVRALKVYTRIVCMDGRGNDRHGGGR
jgi:hypothetical protein